MNIFKKLRVFVKLYILTTDGCYADKKRAGYAKKGQCGGVVGGSPDTGWLSERCVTCKYFGGYS